MNAQKPIRVLIVDDSPIARKIIAAALAHDDSIIVVGGTGDPNEALDWIESLNPDVMTVDITMPRLDALAFLRSLHQLRSMPVLLISPRKLLHPRVVDAVMRWAPVEFVDKPTNSREMVHLQETLASKVRQVATSARAKTPQGAGIPQASAGVGSATRPLNQIILMGASTGGPEVLREILGKLPESMPPILIAQHIPASFSKAFARRMNQLSRLEVREATDGDELREGLVLVAPGDYHMRVLEHPAHRFYVELDKSPPVNHLRPSVDVLFTSAARCRSARIIACLLTGMGSDGALGMKALKESGAHTFAQDEQSCVVFGMPRAARELGVVDHCLPVDRLAEAIHRAATGLGLPSV